MTFDIFCFLIDRSEVIHSALSSYVIMALYFMTYFTNKIVRSIYKMLLKGLSKVCIFVLYVVSMLFAINLIIVFSIIICAILYSICFVKLLIQY